MHYDPELTHLLHRRYIFAYRFFGDQSLCAQKKQAKFRRAREKNKSDVERAITAGRALYVYIYLYTKIEQYTHTLLDFRERAREKRGASFVIEN